MPASAWVFAALYFPALQVLPLYLWHHRPRSDTVYQRMAATALSAAVAGWVPTARRLAEQAGGEQVRLCGCGWLAYGWGCAQRFSMMGAVGSMEPYSRCVGRDLRGHLIWGSL